MKNQFLVLKFCCVFLLIFLCGLNLKAQSKKKLKKYQIKLVEEVITKKTESEDETFKDVLMKVDMEGNVIETIQFKKDGSVKSKINCQYNKNGDLIQEEEFDGLGKLKGKKIMTYNIDGEKITESEFDNLNKLLKKSINTYNAKGLKTDKLIYDGNGKIISFKKYKYTN